MADANTITRIGGMLKNVYSPDYIVEQQNKAVLTRNEYGKADSSARMGGDHMEGSAKLSGNRASVQPQASDDALATASRQTNKKWTVYDRFYTAGIRVFEKDIQNTEGNDRAFASHLKDEVDSVIEDTLTIINQDTFLDGTGGIGSINSGTTSATQTLAVGTAILQYGSQYLVVGDVIDIYDPTLVTSRTSGAGVTVNSITPSSAGAAASVVLSASVATTTGDVVVRAKTGPNKSYIGLLSATNNGSETFEGLSRSTYPIWKSNVVGAAGAAFSESYLQLLNDKIEVAGGATPSEYRTGQAQFSAYLLSGVAQKRFMDAKLDKGFQTVEWNGIPFKKDKDCPQSYIFGLNKKFVQWGPLKALDWMDREGNMLKWDPGYAAYKAVLIESGNYVYPRPNAIGRVEALAVDNARLR